MTTDIPMTTIIDVYREMTERTSEVLFEKGRLLRTAVEAGAVKTDLLKQVGKESGDSKTLVSQIYAVAMVYPDSMIAHDFDWFTHMIAATAPGVDPDDSATYAVAWGWMETAIKGYTTQRHLKSGKVTIVHRKHTARTLRNAIRAAAEPAKPKANPLYKGEAVYLSHSSGTVYTYVTLGILDSALMGVFEPLIQGEIIQLTIARKAPTAPTADVSERREAA